MAFDNQQRSDGVNYLTRLLFKVHTSYLLTDMAYLFYRLGLANFREDELVIIGHHTTIMFANIKCLYLE
eukprot:UN04450